jgi:hypothetical protein
VLDAQKERHAMTMTTQDTSPRLELTVRTPAGIPERFAVFAHDRVDTLLTEAVQHFTRTSRLAAGRYGLALVRNGAPRMLEGAARLSDFGVLANDTLSVIPLDPQVDG